MSLFSRLFDRGDREDRTITSSPFVPTPAEDMVLGGWGGMGTGTNLASAVAPGAAMSVSAFYACVTLLADTVSSLPGAAYRKVDTASIPITPVPRLLANSPYPETTWFEWLWMMMEALTITGNAFAYIVRDAAEVPIGLMPIHPDYISITIEHRTVWPEPIFRLGGEEISAADILHIKRYPQAGCVLGLSPIQKAASAVGLTLAAERYGLNYFRDSANPSSVLETEQTLDDTAAKSLMRRWVASHGGRRLPAVLSGGVKWRPIALTPNESQFLETRQFQRTEIAMWFRIPPHMIGETTKSTSWGTGLEQQVIGFNTFTLRPWLTCIEQRLSTLLPRGQFFKFNIDGLLRGDVKSRWEAYKIGRDCGVYSVNDIRAKEDMPPVENGDIRLQPMNYAPLGYEPPDDATPVEPDPETEPAEDPAAQGEDDEEDDDDEAQ